MMIILNDDPVYLSWIKRHRNGFVLATTRKPTKRNTTLHRATCDEVKHSKTKRTHWTTGRRMKACSEDSSELVEWITEQIGHEPTACTLCNPTGVAVAPKSRPNEHQLTKLESEIVSAVVESAVLHLDNEMDFQMTVGDAAAYLSKTPAQISAALRQLVSDRMLDLAAEVFNGTAIPATVRVFPTAAALSTVPAFAELGDDELRQELDALHG